MTISVILPVHNGGPHLSSAVESVLEQREVEFELLIVDDHSTDGAIEKLAALHDPRVRRLASPGRGIIPALNHGIESAKFDLIARMDADDISLPHRLHAQYIYLLENPHIELCATGVKMFNQNADLGLGYLHYETWINSLIDPKHIEVEFFIESPLPHPTVMFRKQSFVELGGYQDHGWPEDYDLWCRGLLAGYQFGKIPEELLLWRDGANRTSRTDDRYSKLNFLRCKANYLAKFLLNKGISRIQIWGAGPTGCKLHDLLESQGMVVSRFVDVNPKLEGRQKRGKPVIIMNKTNKPSIEENQLDLAVEHHGLIVAAVAARGAREDIRHELLTRNLSEGRDFIFAA